jgi:hypothetical protein
VPTIHTVADFEGLSWHDCHIWGLELRAGAPEEDDWTSDLALDLDFIADWLCGVDGATRFRVAPATLVFHGVSDLRIAIDWGRSDFQVALHDASIDRIDREPVADQKVYRDRPYYRWTIRFNWPRGGEIGFGAVGFTQTLHAEPVLSDAQRLSPSQRSRLLRG